MNELMKTEPEGTVIISSDEDAVKLIRILTNNGYAVAVDVDCEYYHLRFRWLDSGESLEFVKSKC